VKSAHLFLHQNLRRYNLYCSYLLGGHGPFNGFHFHQSFGSNISLTFDDGPDNKATLEISRFIKMNGIQGTFFVLSNKVLENPKLIRTLDEDGHVIGNHTYDHPR